MQVANNAHRLNNIDKQQFYSFENRNFPELQLKLV